MKTYGIPALALKACLILALAGAANACVLIPSSGGAKSGGGGEVTLCHKGNKTMTLPAEAVGAHMDHGDRRGAC